MQQVKNITKMKNLAQHISESFDTMTKPYPIIVDDAQAQLRSIDNEYSNVPTFEELPEEIQNKVRKYQGIITQHGDRVPVSKFISESFVNEDSTVFLIDTKTREYLGTFKNKSEAIKSQKDSISPDDEEIVIGTKNDFEVKSDGKKYYKK